MDHEAMAMLLPLAADRLARLLDVDPKSAWTEQDAAAALRHQLSLPLMPDLGRAPGAEIQLLTRLIEEGQTATARAAGTGTTSFLEQLTCTRPSKELLIGIKNWARHVRGEAANPLSLGPATVIYYATIAAGLLRLGDRITTLSNELLWEGFDWSGKMPGAEGLKLLFKDAAARTK
ncbi:MAG TPA: hypothetical protein VGN88_08325 [Phycisphaerae bacterium]|jgi:hypothetical protein